MYTYKTVYKSEYVDELKLLGKSIKIYKSLPENSKVLFKILLILSPLLMSDFDKKH